MNEINNTDALTLMRSLKEHSVDCILTDPPYFRVNGEFDFAWQTREQFLEDAEKWAEEMERVLKPNGSLVWFASDRMAAYIQVMLERHFVYLNSCTVFKKNSRMFTMSCMDDARKFFPNEERFLFMASKGAELSEDNPAVFARNAHKFAEGMCHTECVMPVIEYLDGERLRAGKSVKEICDALGLKSMPEHWFTKKSQFIFPTRENYEKLRAYLNEGNAGEYLRKEYEELRKEYEYLRRPFHMERRQNDIFTTTVQSATTAKIGHPTVKPLGLIRQLVRTITRPGDLVLDPFLGSGTTAVACRMEGRLCIGAEINADYCKIAQKRLNDTPLYLNL